MWLCPRQSLRRSTALPADASHPGRQLPERFPPALAVDARLDRRPSKLHNARRDRRWRGLCAPGAWRTPVWQEGAVDEGLRLRLSSLCESPRLVFLASWERSAPTWRSCRASRSTALGAVQGSAFAPEFAVRFADCSVSHMWARARFGSCACRAMEFVLVVQVFAYTVAPAILAPHVSTVAFKQYSGVLLLGSVRSEAV